MLKSAKYQEELLEYARNNLELLRLCANKVFFVAGAAGLIGSYLTDLLFVASKKFDLGIKIIACDRDNMLLNERFPMGTEDAVEKLPIDVCTDIFPLRSVDVIVHAASNTSPVAYATKPIDTIWTNICGAKRLIDFSIKAGAKRFLFCSSVEAYGRNNGDVDRFSEDYSGYVDCNTVRAGYPTAKRCVEALCNAYAAEIPAFDFVTARIGRYFGPTVVSGDTKAPSQFIGNALRCEDIMLKSSGAQLFSWGYVGDCATALLTLIMQAPCGCYNVADPEPVTLKEFASFVAEAAGTTLKFENQTEVEKASYSKIDKATMDISKLLSLGWRPSVTIEEGVRRTISYMREANCGKD